MAFLSFKHVGVKTFEVNRIQSTDQSLTPIGIKTPLEFGDEGTGLLKMYFNVGDQLQDNLRNLVLTNHGERLALTTYGANLQPLVADFSSKDDFDSEAMLRINTAVTQWMPYVDLAGFSSQPVFEDNRSVGKVQIVIQYSIPKAQVFNKQLAVTLYVM